MKAKNKIIPMGLALVAIASIVLIMTFAVPGGKSAKWLKKGGKIKIPEVPIEFYSSLDRLMASIDQVIVSVGIYNRIRYGPLARCIKDGLQAAGIETIAIIVIPDLRQGRTYTYYNTGGIVTGGIYASTYSPSGEFLGSSDTVSIGRRSDDPGVIGTVGGYYWTIRVEPPGSIMTFEARGINCSLDTDAIRNAVCLCLDEHRSLVDRKYGRIYIATEEGNVVIDGDCEVVFCLDWETET